MTWADWLVVAILALGALAPIVAVDTPREPATPGGALLFLVCFDLALVVLAHGLLG
jgi:hypothetical protein